MPKHFLRKSLFWPITLLVIPVRISLWTLVFLGSVFTGVEEVAHIAFFRFECWAHGVAPGSFFNCPWRNNYLEAWRTGFHRN